jgi:hypothetical protein
MMNGTSGTATFSRCGTYRWTLTRAWDGRPMLLVCMFNPSTANKDRNDPTVELLCHIAAHNGYGGIVVVNGIPLVSSTPAEAADMVNTWPERHAWDERDCLHYNLSRITLHAERAGAILLAWGALADRCPEWFDHVIEEIQSNAPDGSPILCLGKTAGGHPKHPMARGKHKVPKTAALLPWRSA